MKMPTPAFDPTAWDLTIIITTSKLTTRITVHAGVHDRWMIRKQRARLGPQWVQGDTIDVHIGSGRQKLPLTRGRPRYMKATAPR